MVGLGQKGVARLEENLKKGWNRKERNGNKDFKKERKAGPWGGYLKNRGGAGTPLQTINIFYKKVCLNIAFRFGFFCLFCRYCRPKYENKKVCHFHIQNGCHWNFPQSLLVNIDLLLIFSYIFIRIFSVTCFSLSLSFFFFFHVFSIIWL